MLTSGGSPTGSCNTGDSDVDYTTGEVWTCPSGSWFDTGYSFEGLTGPVGAAGANGADGANVLTSDGSPTGDCSIGDSDIDYTTGKVWTCPSGSWSDTGHSLMGAAGTNGNNGTNGVSTLTSGGSPTGSCNTGDSDIDYTTGEVWTCPSGSWSDTGHSLMGAAGTNGTSTIVSNGSPTGSCNNGDGDIDYTTGEVWVCSSGSWSDTGDSLGNS
jgi:hypothetical protein